MLAPQIVRFGPFQLDLRAAVLRHNGSKSNLAEQPFQILTALIESPGEVVTREELRQRLWPSDTFVDFEHGLNTAVKRLREALGDSAERPRYIETLPRHGYRLMIPVEKLEETAPTNSDIPVRRRGWWLAFSTLAAVAVAAAGLVWWLRSPERFRPVEIQSLAVLPLENLSGKPEEEYFADGMTEELITELGKVHALRVISRQSVMQYKSSNKTIPQIARELSVDAIVEGSAIRYGGRVRITTQLIQAHPERHLWSESYERNLSDAISLQRQIAQTIVREIRVSLTPAEQLHLGKVTPVSPEAYEDYLKGRYHLDRFSVEETKKAREWFQRAIEADPQYPPGYAGLAWTYTLPYGAWTGSVQQDYETARVLIRKAIALDTTLSEAHLVLAEIMFQYDWDWVGAEQEFKRAISLNPSSAHAHISYSELLSLLGRHDEALWEAKTALQLDPVSLTVNCASGYTFYWARQYDQAIEQLRKTVDLDSNYSHSYIGLGRAYLEKRMGQEALNALQKGDILYYAGRRPSNLLGYAYGTLGQRAKALKIVHRLQVLQAQGDPDAASDLARVYVGLGDKDRALRLLETAYRQRYPDMVMLKVDPEFDSLRPDPRFQNLLRKMNFPTQ